MKLSDYKKIVKNPLRPRTLTFLLRNNKVLLGLKKKGFGKGYYLGIGGKVEQNETIEEGAKREIKEEILVDVKVIQPMGTLDFYFPHIKDESWNQQVYIFIVKQWEGEPTETKEIKPIWFDKTKIPLNLMWDDDRYWFEKVLQGKKVKAEFTFDKKLKVEDSLVIFSE